MVLITPTPPHSRAEGRGDQHEHAQVTFPDEVGRVVGRPELLGENGELQWGEVGVGAGL